MLRAIKLSALSSCLVIVGCGTTPSGSVDSGDDTTNPDAADASLDADGAEMPDGSLECSVSGALDPTFGVGGLAPSPFTVDAGGGDILIDQVGRVVVSGGAKLGDNYAFVILRYLPDGSLDPTFGNGLGWIEHEVTCYGDASSIVEQPDGKLIVSGVDICAAHASALVLRFDTDGTLDLSFGEQGIARFDNDYATTLETPVLDASGRICAAALLEPDEDSADILALRLDNTGMLTSDYGTGGFAETAFSGSNDTIGGGTLLPDGHFYITGAHDLVGAVARYDESGVLDPTFGAGGVASTGIDQAWFVNAKPDLDAARNLVAVGAHQAGAVLLPLIARFTPDGVLDAAFGNDGTASPAFDGAGELFATRIDSAGRIVVVGETGSPSPSPTERSRSWV